MRSTHVEGTLRNLEITRAVWENAFRLGQKVRERGLTIPAIDLLIAACGRHHGVEIEHADEHFNLLAGMDPGRKTGRKN